ncbi:hypothetical protein PO883_33290 [Massilia sp. DJPM01]|uniref:hypothetical protein n=1 Tax=Massilia sp. DJPM01 TaxID=3024404 RepID=UPI00259EB576|nr:hypothetical protein [Massilia sp. DJPM01]MDM5182051.1 hypothetical protein [Massilia sp. DJPM01]
MMEKLLLGSPASKIFRALQHENASIGARELGYILMAEFPNISPAASMSIRKWLNPAMEEEFPDEQIDALILHYLKEAGYVT